jgi:hypothetical protein
VNLDVASATTKSATTFARQVELETDLAARQQADLGPSRGLGALEA